MMSVWEQKTIYSKRYPKVEVEEALKDAETPHIDSDAEGGWRRFSEQLEETSVHPDNPEKVLKSKRLVKLAIETSSIYQIDTDVVEGCGYVTVIMFFDCGDFMGELKDRFAELFRLCDDFAFFQIPQSRCDITLLLTCNTR